MGDRSGEGAAYSNLGNCHFNLGDFKTAIEYHERALKNAKELGTRQSEGGAYGNLGNAYCCLGEFKTATDYFERDLKIAKELSDSVGEGRAYSNLGNTHARLGDFKMALDYYERHLKIAEELGDRSGEGKAYGNLGITYQSLGGFQTAIDFQDRRLKIAKEIGDRLEEEKAYSHLGCVHHSLGDFKTAINYHERELKIAIELGDRMGEGAAYGNLGNTHSCLGNFKTAKYYYERHLIIVKELGDISGEGTAYGNLGIAHRNLGDFKTAIDYLERDLRIAKTLGDKTGNARACGNLGTVYQSLGDFKTAVNYHERHAKIAKELGDRSGEGRAYGNLGSVHSFLGDFKTAMKYYEHDLKIAEELGDRLGEGITYGNLGNVYQSLGDFKTAIDYHERHLKIAKELGDKSGEGRAYGNLGNSFLCLEDFKTSIDYLERALKVAKALGDKLGEGIACSNLGHHFQYLGQAPVAIEYYQLSVTLLNNIRDRLQFNDDWKISLRDHYQTIYAALWRLMVAEGKVNEALLAAEQGRAQGLKDLMALNYGFEVNDAELDDGNKTFQELSSRIPPNTIFMAIGANELICWVCQRGKESELRRKEISSHDEIGTFFETLLEVVGQEIGVGDYVECEDRSLKLANEKRTEVQKSASEGRQSHHLNLQKSALNSLYDIIIEPIQDLFEGSELLFVPEGPLCLAPFAAFKAPNSKYLCESFRIRVAPSLTSLKMIADCPADYHCKSGVLLVGDPWVQDVTELKQLPYAREEVEMIGRMLGCTPLIGRQATKDAVLRRLGSVALVHIAAHGSMETGEIALAPDNGEMDFILTMKDVKRVQIRARLVVLSCCHSGHGEIKAEGVVGIARAFLGAGARSVLVSLWAVDDKATLEFMKNFYQHLLKGKSSSEALNQTMNCMRESEVFGAVKYWAPFVLIGDDVTIEFAGCE